MEKIAKQKEQTQSMPGEKEERKREGWRQTAMSCRKVYASPSYPPDGAIEGPSLKQPQLELTFPYRETSQH